jgi:beta-lactamase class A
VLLLAIAGAQPASAAGALDAQMEAIAVPANGHVGAAVRVFETGESAAFRGDDRFPMQSVYKLPIGMAVLRDVDEGRLALDQAVRVEKSDLVPRSFRSPIRDAHPQGGFDLSLTELLRFAVSESDGTASDVLLRVAGGGARVTRYLEGLGVTGVVVATSEREMDRGPRVQYRNWATPLAAVELLCALQEGRGVSAPSRELLLRLLTETGTGPQRLKGLLPEGTIVAHKTGTSSTSGGLSRATNDIGLVTLPDGRHMAIAVFVSDSTADVATREGVIARIARAAWDTFQARR